MQGGKYCEKEKVATFVTQLEAEVIEDKMGTKYTENANILNKYYFNALSSIVPSSIECTFFAGDKVDSENVGGNFNAGDNYRNFGGAGSSFGGNQTNSGGFGGQANQSGGFNSPQPQQQQSNFSNQMGVGGGGGSFGNQGNSFSSNAASFNAGPSPGGGNYSAQSSYGQTTGFSGSGFGGQMSSGLSTGMTTGNYKDANTVCTHVQPGITVLCVIL